MATTIRLAQNLAQKYRSWLVSSCLLVVAVSVRLLYGRQAARLDPTFADPTALTDSLYYHTRAHRLALGEELGVGLDFLSPSYIQALKLLYRVVGPEPLAAIGLHVLLAAISCVMLYLIGRRIFSEASGILAGMILACFGPQVYYGGLILSDTLVLTVNVAFLLAMTPPRMAFSPVRGLAAGMLLGLAVGARPNAILLAPVALLAIWVQTKPIVWRRHGPLAMALLLGLAIGLAPFAYRNHQAIGEPLVLGPTGGINLWKGNGPKATGTHVFLEYVESQAGVMAQMAEEVSDKEVLAESRDLTKRTIEYVKEHPWRTARLLAKKAALFFHSVEIGIRDQFYLARSMAPALWLAPLTYGVVAPLGLAGMWLARARREAALLYGVFAVQFASLVLIFVLGRYRLVAVAILALFAGFALTTWARAWRERTWRASLPSLGLALLVAGLVHLPMGEFNRDRGVTRRHMDIANAYLSQGRYDEAIRSFEAAALAAGREPFPEANIAGAQMGMAWVHITAGEHEEALILLRPFMGPEIPHAIRERARILWELTFDGE